ncbi:hypothetical protein GCM10023336_28560 [Streptomyces similanensis]|uniref:Transposase n=1 Tax=Streptomyces similanensis TaxID=1274988 RepID=A0ABP9KG16_9ACTN
MRGRRKSAGAWSSGPGAGAGNRFGKAFANAVTAEALRVHVHLLMQLHMNKVMIRVS